MGSTRVDDRGLKLAAMDEADLAILSAHLQDAVLKRSEMDYVPANRRFVLACNRFDWQDAAAKENGGVGARLSKLVGKGPTYQRRRASLVIDHVSGAAHRDFALRGRDTYVCYALFRERAADRGDRFRLSG